MKATKKISLIQQSFCPPSNHEDKHKAKISTFRRIVLVGRPVNVTENRYNPGGIARQFGCVGADEHLMLSLILHILWPQGN